MIFKRLAKSRSIGMKAESALGPGLPTLAVQQVGSYRGYTGRDGNAAAKAAHDPSETLAVHCVICFSPDRSTCFNECNAVV
jgi:hypothetical protein